MPTDDSNKTLYFCIVNNIYYQMERRRLLIMFVGLFTSTLLFSQVAGLKTNILMDATKTINLGAEIGLGKQATMDLTFNYNPWNNNSKMTKMFAFQPEYRYWLCERFNGHFLGIHAHAGVYQFAGVKMPFGIWKNLEEHRFKGHFYGGGISYGYQWVLGKHWNLEGNIGVGYARVKYEQFKCRNCEPKVGEGNKNYFGPTKAGVSLIYLF